MLQQDQLTIRISSNEEQLVLIYSILNRLYIQYERPYVDKNIPITERGLRVIEIHKGSYILVLTTRIAIGILPEFINVFKRLVKYAQNKQMPSELSADLRRLLISFLIELAKTGTDVLINDMVLSIEVIWQCIKYLLLQETHRSTPTDKDEINKGLNNMNFKP